MDNKYVSIVSSIFCVYDIKASQNNYIDYLRNHNCFNLNLKYKLENLLNFAVLSIENIVYLIVNTFKIWFVVTSTACGDFLRCNVYSHEVLNAIWLLLDVWLITDSIDLLENAFLFQCHYTLMKKCWLSCILIWRSSIIEKMK